MTCAEKEWEKWCWKNPSAIHALLNGRAAVIETDVFGCTEGGKLSSYYGGNWITFHRIDIPTNKSEDGK